MYVKYDLLNNMTWPLNMSQARQVSQVDTFWELFNCVITFTLSNETWDQNTNSVQSNSLTNVNFLSLQLRFHETWILPIFNFTEILIQLSVIIFCTQQLKTVIS